MKKKLLFATIILVLLAGILYYISLPDYLVFNSMSFSNGANRDTELQVIVYQYWNTDAMDMNHFIVPLSIIIKKKKQTVNKKTVCNNMEFTPLTLSPVYPYLQ